MALICHWSIEMNVMEQLTAAIALAETHNLLFLLAIVAIVFLFEAAFPLFRYGRTHVRNLIVNVAIAAILVGLDFAVGSISPHGANFVTRTRFGLSNWLGLSPLGQLILGVLGIDLFQFLAHMILHKYRPLWAFHRVHHCDNQVDVTTGFRKHPAELLWKIPWYIAAIALFGVPAWVLAFYLAVSTLNAALEHANFRLPATLDRWLRVVYVTPNMHKVHHSRLQPETDSNYGDILSIWDRLFRTYNPGPRFDELRYGLDGLNERGKQSLGGLLKMPFMPSWGKPATLGIDNRTGEADA